MTDLSSQMLRDECLLLAVADTFGVQSGCNLTAGFRPGADTHYVALRSSVILKPQGLA